MIRRPFRYYYLKVTRQRGTPESIALGMSIGVFWGLFIPVAQILFALFAATLVRANRVTAFVGTWISNPITFPLMVPFYLLVGRWLTGVHVDPMTFPQEVEPGDPGTLPGLLESWMHGGKVMVAWFWVQGLKLVLVWFAAATPTSVIGAVLSYYPTRWLVEEYRRTRLKRRQRLRQKLERKAAEEEAIRGIHMGLDEK